MLPSSLSFPDSVDYAAFFLAKRNLFFAQKYSLGPLGNASLDMCHRHGDYPFMPLDELKSVARKVIPNVNVELEIAEDV